jgi:hypothetical protein
MRYVWTSQKALGILLLLLVVLGYGLFWCLQPQCEPCLPGTDCQPCISQVQYFVMGSTILVIVIALMRLFVLKRQSSAR